ncbi:hypothetical protein [uncultured Eudoraea sp.]|uniref:hypothetical protein n=1 Tax=uncultured Eudoraea sp. TaxID=1035614 RepID=UPI002636B745|nr:hypothetical protein [uncultured Eudoraea sp.]
MAFLVLFQGCVVYHKTPTTLEQARQEHIKTKITNTDNETMTYKYITYEEGTFYGVTTRYGKEVKKPLNKEDIVRILTKNKSASTWVTVTVIAGPIIALIIAMAAVPGFGLASAP